jgi:hypothetical protein
MYNLLWNHVPTLDWLGKIIDCKDAKQNSMFGWGEIHSRLLMKTSMPLKGRILKHSLLMKLANDWSMK